MPPVPPSPVAAASSPDASAFAEPPRLALVLPGGGARAAFQVGVLKALADLVPRDAPLPFRVVSGTSAGAILAALVASHADRFRQGACSLERFWRNFRIQDVFRTDTASMLGSGLHFLLALVSGGHLASPRSVFDNSPLRDLLERHVNFARIRQHVDHGQLGAIAINASDYRTARSVSFYQCRDPQAATLRHWHQGTPAELSLDHLMASTAVPFLFPPVPIDGEYYGDGAMRQLAPLTPAIKLGADRLLVVGVRPPDDPGIRGAAEVIPHIAHGAGHGPTFGQIFGFMLDTLFMDGVQADLERVERANELVAAAGAGATGLRRIEVLSLTPRVDFGPIAERHAGEVPSALRALLRVMGAANPGGRTLLSYLLFQGSFARELIAHGYADAMARREELQALLRSMP